MQRRARLQMHGSLWAGLKPDFLQVIARITAYPSKGTRMVSTVEKDKLGTVVRNGQKQADFPQPQKDLPSQTDSALRRVSYSTSGDVAFVKLKAKQKARLRQSRRWQELLRADGCNCGQL
jgi:hypothetical protein